MSEFVNTIELLGDDAVADSIINRSITEFKDDKITEIGLQAFGNCVNLKEIDCPKVTKTDMSFFKCTGLLSVNLPELIDAGNETFSLCSGLLDIYIPKIKKIGRYCFQNCSLLTNISMPEIETIDTLAFNNCSELALTSLPSSLKSLSSEAFTNCGGLVSLTFEGKPTSIASNAFSRCYNLKTINVPWAEGEVANAPWGATNATINYNYTGG